MKDNSSSVKDASPLRGPTKDYREFRGEYRSRYYSIYRIIITNFNQMISSKWAIAIIILSYLFLSFNLLGLVFSEAIENGQMYGEYDDKTPIAIFTIEPEEGQDALIEAPLGSDRTIAYDIMNTGEDTGRFSTLIFKPNQYWSTFVDVKGKAELSPGESSRIEVMVSIPDTQEKFSNLSGTDPFKTLAQRYSRLHDNQYDLSTIDREPSRLPVINPESANIVYSYNTTRAITLVVAPTDLLEEISLEDPPMFDVRIRSAATLFMIENSTSPITPGLEIYSGGDDLIQVSMKAPSTKTTPLILKNNGKTSIRASIECILLPVSDPSMVCFFEIDEQLDGSLTDITLESGQEMEIRLVIYSGELSVKVSYNFLIIATQTSSDSPHISTAVHGIARIKGTSYETPKEGEKYHEILWGGGFNYERYLWIILLAAFAGSAVISRDVQENSIGLYLSKPITWYDYLIAKFSALFLMLSSITLIPATILFLTGMAFSRNDLQGILNSIPLLFGMVLSYAFAVIVFGSVCMAFSTMIKKWIFAGASIFVFFIFTSTISDIMLALFNNTYLKLLNLNMIFKNVFKPLFGLGYDSDHMGMEWYIPVLFLIGICVACWGLMIFKFRIKEMAK